MTHLQNADLPLTKCGDRHRYDPATTTANLKKLCETLDALRLRKEGETSEERWYRYNEFIGSVAFTLSAYAHPADLDHAIDEGKKDVARLDANQKQKCAP